MNLVGTVVRCPEPLRLRKDGEADPPCQLPCPTPYWTESQYHVSALWTVSFKEPL